LKYGNILAIIPARGRSKGIPRKNIKLFSGKPLIVYSIVAAKASKQIDKIVVSTEDEEIAEISKKFGVKVIKRPIELSEDNSTTMDVVKHVLSVLKETENYIPGVVVLLQPTSPLRTVKTIEMAISKFLENYEDYDSLLPIYPIKSKIGTIKKGFFIPNYVLGSQRQNIEQIYKECGTIFIFKTNLIEEGKMFGKRLFPFIIQNYEESIDIDTIDDFKQAEYLESKNEK